MHHGDRTRDARANEEAARRARIAATELKIESRCSALAASTDINLLMHELRDPKSQPEEMIATRRLVELLRTSADEPLLWALSNDDAMPLEVRLTAGFRNDLLNESPQTAVRLGKIFRAAGNLDMAAHMVERSLYMDASIRSNIHAHTLQASLMGDRGDSSAVAYAECQQEPKSAPLSGTEKCTGAGAVRRS